MHSASELNAEEWKYSGEGGANVIFRYIGLDCSYRGFVLRVRKVGVRGAHPKDIVAFASRYMPRGSKNGYEQVAFVIPISKACIEKFNLILQESERPSHRRGSLIDISLTHAMLLPDIVSRVPHEAISIEIKPKSSLLPQEAHVRTIKKSVCRFCMHQHMKSSQGKVDVVSQYCPLRLFSSNENDISDALHQLAKTPQNNFRILSQNTTSSEHDEYIEVLAHFLSSNVSILDDIKALHHSDAIDIEGVNAITTLKELLSPWPHDSPKVLSEQMKSLDTQDVEEIHAIKHVELAMSKFHIGDSIKSWRALTSHEFHLLYSKVHEAFLIATTFKDCSLLLSLTKSSCSAFTNLLGPFEHIINKNGSTYRCVLAVVDLDIKAHKSVSSYYELDQRVVSHFESVADISKVHCAGLAFPTS